MTQAACHMKFRESLILYASLTSLTALSIDALLPGLRAIGEEFGATPLLSTQHVISLFIFGMAFGELLLGPLSDAIGRKRALLFGLGLYAIGTLIALSSQSLEMVVLGRFLQGAGVSGPKIATRAMIRDQFDGSAMARVMSLMFTLFILVPMIAPALAMGLISVAGWRSIFVAYLLIALILGLWLAVRHPETLPAHRRIPVRPRLLLTNGFRIVANARVMLLTVATGLVFGAQLLYLSTAADIFHDAYGVTESLPMYFAGLAISMALAFFLNSRLVQRFGMEAMARAAFIGFAGSAVSMMSACLLLDNQPPFPAFLATLFVSFFATGLLFGNLNALAMQSLGEIAGFGASIIASGSSLVSTVFALVFGRFYDGTSLYLAAGFVVASICSAVLAEIGLRSDPSPVRAAQPAHN